MLPAGLKVREQTFRAGSPSTVSTTKKILIEVVSFLLTLDKTWLWNMLGAHSSLREQPKSSAPLSKVADEGLTLARSPTLFPPRPSVVGD